MSGNRLVLDGWIKMATTAVVGAVSGMISVVLWVSNQERTVEAHEISIQRLQAADNIVFDQLRQLDVRLARIESKIDILLNDKYK